MRKDLERLESAMTRIARIANSPKGDADRCLRADVDPLPPVAQRILREVVERGPARVSEIARATRTGDAAVSRQVSLLEDLGLLRRESDARDGRAALVSMTPEGQRVSRRLRRAADEIFQERLAGWTSARLERLAELIDQLADDLSTPPRHDDAPRR